MIKVTLFYVCLSVRKFPAVIFQKSGYQVELEGVFINSQSPRGKKSQTFILVLSCIYICPVLSAICQLYSDRVSNILVPSDRVSNIRLGSSPLPPVFKLLNALSSLFCFLNLQEVKAFVPCWMPQWLQTPSKALIISFGAEWWFLTADASTEGVKTQLIWTGSPACDVWFWYSWNRWDESVIAVTNKFTLNFWILTDIYQINM